MKLAHKPRLERLEDRFMPSSSAPLWPLASRLTLSFVPDGTSVNGTPSALFQSLNAVAPTASWETEILRAAQTWASNTNANIGIVSDDGSPLGTPGCVQSDSRFGDIRIAGANLPAGTVATASPFSWTGTTWNGDIVFNTQYNFGINGSGQYDLYTVALHELGHIFGLADTTTDTQSVEYYNYTGPRTGLAPEDITALQAAYGTRLQDSFDTQQSNGSFKYASTIGYSTGATYSAQADLTTATDVDYYKFQTTTNTAFKGFTFYAQSAGLSLLVPTLSIYDSTQKLVATATATGPLNNSLSIYVAAKPGTTYYAKVSAGQSGALGIGGYQLSITSQIGSLSPSTPPVQPFYSLGPVAYQNNSFSSAIDLTNANNNLLPSSTRFMYQESLAQSTDRDFFKVKSPGSTGVLGYSFSVIAWGGNVLGPKPIVHAYDSRQCPLRVQVVSNGNSTYAIQVANAIPNSTYYIEVDPYPGVPLTAGTYAMYASFDTAAPLAPETLGSNMLQTAGSGDTATLTTTSNELFQFLLSTSSSSSDMSVTMTITNQTGQTIVTLTALANQPPLSATVYLKAGSYTVTYSANVATGGSVAPVNYWLSGLALSDEQGPYYTGGSSSTGGTYTYSGPSSGGSSPYLY